MAEAKAPAVPVLTAPVEFENVTIPAKNTLGWDHPGVGINLTHYKPGKHLVHPDIAAEINRILVRYEKEVIRILRPDRDPSANNSLDIAN